MVVYLFNRNYIFLLTLNARIYIPPHIPKSLILKTHANTHTDDWRHDSLGSVKPHIRTPFLDQLGKWGIRFSHNCVTTSVCWMSRATLFTGQYTSEHKSYKLKCPQFTKPEAWNNSWPALLQRVGGYFVGHVRTFFIFSKSTGRTSL